MTDDADAQELNTQIAALQQRLSDLERAKPKPGPTEAEIAKAYDDLHQLRERNASAIPPWMREAVRGGVSDADARDIARARHAPQGPSTQTPQDLKEVRTTPARLPAGGGTGVAREIPFGPSMHQRYVDAQLDAQDAKDRQQRLREEARRREYEEQIEREVALRLALKGRE
jgi:hypothetical protein